MLYYNNKWQAPGNAIRSGNQMRTKAGLKGKAKAA